jgi:hypothetical protein
MPPASTAAPSVGRKDSNQPHAEAAEALAVGAIPEELPAVVRITLIIGVSRMAALKWTPSRHLSQAARRGHLGQRHGGVVPVTWTWKTEPALMRASLPARLG